MEQQSGCDSRPSSSTALHEPFSPVIACVSWQPSVTGGPLTGTFAAPAQLQCVLFHISNSSVYDLGTHPESFDPDSAGF